jgi:hypothetical protein
MPALIAWRFKVLINGLRAGSCGEFSRSVAVEKWNMFASWSVKFGESERAGAGGAFAAGTRTIGRSSAAAIRVALGPLYRRLEIWLWSFVFAAPVLLSLRPGVVTLTSAMFFVQLASFCWALIGAGMILVRVRRLADFLQNQGGEISDVALLPGLGNTRVHRRALLLEVLIRPLIHYALGMGMVIVGWSALMRVVRAPLQPILTLAFLACAMLLLHATMSVGVLSRRLDRTSPWFNGWAYLLMICAWGASFARVLACVLGSRCVYESTLELPAWLNLLWVPVLGGMAACLVAWALQLSRRQNLLCR